MLAAPLRRRHAGANPRNLFPTGGAPVLMGNPKLAFVVAVANLTRLIEARQIMRDRGAPPGRAGAFEAELSAVSSRIHDLLYALARGRVEGGIVVVSDERVERLIEAVAGRMRAVPVAADPTAEERTVAWLALDDRTSTRDPARDYALNGFDDS